MNLQLSNAAVRRITRQRNLTDRIALARIIEQALFETRAANDGPDVTEDEAIEIRNVVKGWSDAEVGNFLNAFTVAAHTGENA